MPKGQPPYVIRGKRAAASGRPGRSGSVSRAKDAITQSGRSSGNSAPRRGPYLEVSEGFGAGCRSGKTGASRHEPQRCETSSLRLTPLDGGRQRGRIPGDRHRPDVLEEIPRRGQWAGQTSETRTQRRARHLAGGRESGQAMGDHPLELGPCEVLVHRGRQGQGAASTHAANERVRARIRESPKRRRRDVEIFCQSANEIEQARGSLGIQWSSGLGTQCPSPQTADPPHQQRRVDGARRQGRRRAQQNPSRQHEDEARHPQHQGRPGALHRMTPGYRAPPRRCSDRRVRTQYSGPPMRAVLNPVA